MSKSITDYEEMGYPNRTVYLESIACDYGIDVDTVKALADVLGPSEDFDGLVSALDDFCED